MFILQAQYKCSCGFSAVSNRQYGFCTGLFYDDECDIMNHRDERFDKRKLRALVEKSQNEVCIKIIVFNINLKGKKLLFFAGLTELEIIHLVFGE